jgi:hypothetical protein
LIGIAEKISVFISPISRFNGTSCVIPRTGGVKNVCGYTAGSKAGVQDKKKENKEN